MREIIRRWQSLTDKIEPMYTLVGAPILQESIFRLVPYKLYLTYGGFYAFGIVGSVLFAVFHWYFARWFALFTLIGSVVLWIVIVHYGFLWAVILHSIANLILLKLGVLQKLKRVV